MTQRDVVKFDFYTGKKVVEPDMLAVEKPVQVYISGEYFSTFFASPEREKELVIGHMLSEGLIESVDDVRETRFINDRNVDVTLRERLRVPKTPRVFVSATAGFDNFLEVLRKMKGLPIVSDLKIEAKKFQKMAEIVQDEGKVHETSKGTHLAAIFTKDAELVSFSEDVGRHNAVDKVIGSAGLRRLNFSQLVLLSSGRQSAHMVLKAARVGIPIIVTLAYPLESGMRVAERTGITLVHFRERILKVYTFPERISFF